MNFNSRKRLMKLPLVPLEDWKYRDSYLQLRLPKSSKLRQKNNKSRMTFDTYKSF